MSVLGKILVKLGLDNSEYKKGLNDSKQQTDKFSSTMSKVGLAIAGAFTIDAIKNFATSAVKAYNESAAAAAKFNAVVRATGGAAGITTEEMQRFASQLQSVTTFEDDATTSAASLLATFKSVNGDVFKQAIVSAQDLATIMGGDLQGAIMQIGKALESPEIGLVALRRSGISFTEMQIEQIKKLVEEGKKHEAQLIILKEIQSQVGGAAKAAAETAGGAWTQAFNAIGDVMEQIGSGVEKTSGFAKFLKEGAEGMNTILSSEDLSGWEKLGVIFGFNNKAARKLSESISFLSQKSKENRAIVDGIMEEQVKSAADAQYQLQFLTNVQKGSYQELLKQELQAYIKRANAAKLDQEEKQKQIALAKQLAEAEKGRGEIPQKEAEIENLRNKLKNAFGEERQQIIDTIALRQQELAVLRMTTAEKLKARNEKAIQTPAMTGFDINAKNPMGGTLNPKQPFDDWLKNNKDSRQGAIDDITNDMATIDALSQQFVGAIQQGAISSLDALSSALAGVGDMNAGQIVAAIISPLADMAISAGTLIMLTGQGIESLKVALTGFFGVGAIAAGAILVGFGVAAKTGLKAIAKGSKGGAAGGGNMTSYSGGGAVAGYSGAMATTSAMSINVTGRISGSDIVLSYDKTKDNKSR